MRAISPNLMLTKVTHYTVLNFIIMGLYVPRYIYMHKHWSIYIYMYVAHYIDGSLLLGGFNIEYAR